MTAAMQHAHKKLPEPLQPTAAEAPAMTRGHLQMKQALVGRSFAEQEAMLKPPAEQVATKHGSAQNVQKEAKQAEATLSPSERAARIAAVSADNRAKFRTEPSGLDEQLALQAAMSGHGRVVMGQMNDPRLAGMKVAKIEHTHAARDALGNTVKICVHYFRDLDTNQDFAFKFKNDPLKKPGE